MKALDLFAGTGWGVACRWLGIEEDGVEIMPEAVATREANGMKTIYNDVWDGLKLTKEGYQDRHGIYWMLIASPPCQTYSMAGLGAGREALDEVIQAITDHLYKDPDQLIQFGEKHDPRTALVLTPLAYIWRDMPRYVVLEQVPTVQPVWEAYAEVMRGWGYTVETAVLNAEQYGVPQTRRRSILIANLDGPISLPKPTHSRYYPRDPKRLDPGVLPWVSMAEVLGWTAGGSFAQNNSRPNQAIRSMDQPAPTITAGHDSGNRGFIGEDSFTVATPDQVAALQSYPSAVAAATADPRPEWAYNRPSTTVVGSFSPDIISTPRGREKGGHSRQSQPGSVRVTPEQASTLQTFPEKSFVWCGAKSKVFLQIGNAVPPVLAAAVLRSVLDAESGMNLL